MTTLRKRILDASSASEPKESLIALAEEQRDSGLAQQRLYQEFTSVIAPMDSDDPRLDALLDVMDMIAGGPWAKGCAIYDTELDSR